MNSDIVKQIGIELNLDEKKDYKCFIFIRRR